VCRRLPGPVPARLQRHARLGPRHDAGQRRGAPGQPVLRHLFALQPPPTLLLLLLFSSLLLYDSYSLSPQAFFSDFSTFSRQNLPHFARHPHRHLFLFPIDSMFMPKWLGSSMLAHTGAGYRNKSRIDMTVPHLVSLPRDLLAAPTPGSQRKTHVFLMASPSRNKVNVLLCLFLVSEHTS